MLKTLKIILVLITLTSFHSCQITPIQINQLTKIDNKCYIRGYRYSKDYLGPVASAKETSEHDCNKMIGYSIDDYLTLQEWLESVRKKINTQD